MGSMFLAIAVIAVAFWFFRSPLCCSIADSIRSQHGRAVDADLAGHLEESIDHLTDAVSALRAELYELGERVDFTERALTAVQRREVVPDASERG